MSRRRINEFCVTLPPLGWLMVFFLVPTLVVAWIAFKPYDHEAPLRIGAGWTLASVRAVLDKEYPKILFRTLWVSAVSTGICIVLGISMAYYMARISERMKKTMLLLTVIPFWTSFIIRIFAWTQVLQSDGFVQRLAVFLRLMPEDGTLMYTMQSVLLVMVYTSLPFAILPLYAAAEKFDFQLMEAAMDLGATRLQALRKTFIPGIRSGILFATLMVLIPNLGCYVASEVIGGTDCYLLGNRIKECALDTQNLPHACALSLSLMLGVLFVLGCCMLVIRFKEGRGALSNLARQMQEVA
ncbi:MAG: ABC transporter permease [Kiritimatiellaeota bacterium]|nr:ABC transporter permease [Kiritimatiellota bacterium]